MEQFVIIPVDLPLLGSLSHLVVYLVLAGAVCLALSGFAPVLSRGTRLAPGAGHGGFAILSESLYRTLLNMSVSYAGKAAMVYFPLLYALFHLILVSNLMGLVPFTATPTVEFVLTLSLSASLLLGIFFLGLRTHGSLVAAAFLPAGTPLPLVPVMIALESLAYLIKVVSLGLRLAINLSTGHILVHTLVGFIWAAYLEGTNLIFLGLPLLLLSLFLALEILIAYLQSYIFTFIVCLTLRDLA